MFFAREGITFPPDLGVALFKALGAGVEFTRPGAA